MAVTRSRLTIDVLLPICRGCEHARPCVGDEVLCLLCLGADGLVSSEEHERAMERAICPEGRFVDAVRHWRHDR